MPEPQKIDRQAIERAAAQAQFETSPEPAAVEAPIPPGAMSEAEARTAKLMRMDARQREEARENAFRTMKRLTLSAVLVALVVGGGAAFADYQGWIHLGIFKTPEPEPTPAIVRPIPAVYQADPPQPMPHAKLPEVVPVVDQAALARAKARAAHLDAGIDLMRREQVEADAQGAASRAALSMRPRPTPSPRIRPWSAAETLDEIAIYVREHPTISDAEKWDLQRHHDAAQADCTSATKRLAELAEKKASLQARIDKAQVERDSIIP